MDATDNSRPLDGSLPSMRIERQTAPVRTLAASALRSAIAERRFKPGDRLRERELCALVGVSRTSVREALRQLEAEGLVAVTPQGPIVATISSEEAAELYEVRAVLEGLAGRLAAERATDADKAKLSEVVAQLESVPADEAETLVHLKERFYQVLFDAAGNHSVSQILAGLRARINFLRMTSLSEPDRLEEAIQELHAVVGAISDGDLDGAERACRQHVSNAGSVVGRLLALGASDEQP